MLFLQMVLTGAFDLLLERIGASLNGVAQGVVGFLNRIEEKLEVLSEPPSEKFDNVANKAVCVAMLVCVTGLQYSFFSWIASLPH